MAPLLLAGAAAGLAAAGGFGCGAAVAWGVRARSATPGQRDDCAHDND